MFHKGRRENQIGRYGETFTESCQIPKVNKNTAEGRVLGCVGLDCFLVLF